MRLQHFFLAIIMLVCANLETSAQYSPNTSTSSADSNSRVFYNLSLDDCIDHALEFNRNNKAAGYAIEVAEAQYTQAISGRYPELTLTASYSRLDDDPNFIFPSFQMSIPAIDLSGVGFGQLQLPTVDVPELDIKLMDKQAYSAGLELKYPIYTGGLITSYIDQAESAIEIANHELKKSSLTIVHNVKKYFYSVILADTVYNIGKETLEKLRATLDITKNVYEKGSGRVKKTDYLKAKLIVDNVNSMVTSFASKKQVALAALKNAIGLDRNSNLVLKNNSLVYMPYNLDFEYYLGGTYEFNPDWAKINSALKVFEAKVDEAKSGHYPKVAIIGSIQRIENSYDYGLASKANKTMFSIGVGMELPIFKGFRTVGEVDEAKARLNILKEQKILLHDGLAVMLEKSFLELKSAQESHVALTEAFNTSVENLELTERAYQIEMVEEKDLLEAQMIEAVMRAKYQLSIFDHIMAKNELDFIIGSEVERQIIK